MLYNTWIFAWLITMTQFIAYFLLFHTSNVVFLMMVFLFTFLIGLPALIPFAIYWFFLKKKQFTKQQILLSNIVAAVIVGGALGGYAAMVIINGEVANGDVALWPYYTFPATGGALAVLLNQKAIYKGLQNHFHTYEVLDTIYK